MKIIDTEQGSDAWFEVRAKMPTASNFKKIYTGLGKKSTQWKKYAFELISKKYGGEDVDFKGNKWTDRGNEFEPEARNFYEFACEKVDQVGFVYRDDMSAGCSPDGLIGNNGGLEIKCLKGSEHLDMLTSGEMPTEYIPQVQGSLWVTDREWWDFLGYHPKFKHILVRIWRDEKYINGLCSAILEFNEKMREIENNVLGSSNK